MTIFKDLTGLDHSFEEEGTPQESSNQRDFLNSYKSGRITLTAILTPFHKKHQVELIDWTHEILLEALMTDVLVYKDKGRAEMYYVDVPLKDFPLELYRQIMTKLILSRKAGRNE